MSTGSAAIPTTHTRIADFGVSIRRRTAVGIVFAVLAAKLAFLVVLALNSAFVMDEYAMAVHGLFSIDHLYKEIWPAKTVLYAPIFRIPHLLAEGAAEIMLVARAQMSAVAVGALALLYLVARQIGRSRLEALLIVVVVLTFRSHIEWAFMVRPEPVALLYGLAALWLVTRRRGGLGLCLVAGLISGVAFLTLQKAAYLNLALGLALVGDGIARRVFRDAIASGAALLLGWGVVVGAYYLFFMALGADFTRTLDYTLAGPALQNALIGHEAYEGGLRRYLVQTVMRDAPLYLLCAAGLVMSGSRLLKMDRSERRAWIFTLVISILISFHRAPWPYNFVLAVPFLALWSVVPFQAVPATRIRARRVMIRVTIALVGVSFLYNVHYLSHDNALQSQAARRAESLLRPGDRYSDGVGMLVNRTQAGSRLPGQVFSWDRPTILSIRGMTEQGDMKYFERIFDGAPKVWIQTYRSDKLEEFLAPFMERAYVPIFPNVLIAGIELRPGVETEFQNWWPGRYRLYRADGTSAAGELTLDGRRMEGSFRVVKGRHNVLLMNGDAPLYLLPADIEGVPFNMTTARARQKLFDRVYTY
jgi:hypothetical protein